MTFLFPLLSSLFSLLSSLFSLLSSLFSSLFSLLSSHSFSSFVDSYLFSSLFSFNNRSSLCLFLLFSSAHSIFFLLSSLLLSCLPSSCFCLHIFVCVCHHSPKSSPESTLRKLDGFRRFSVRPYFLSAKLRSSNS